jgi:methanethiol S-methyltransferase
MPGEDGTAAKTLAVFCYVLALTGQGALIVLVVLLGLNEAPRPIIAVAGDPWLVDSGWLFAFSLQHSGMARAGLKRRWTRLVPPPLERSLYAGLAGLVLVGLCLAWQLLPGDAIWRLPFWVMGIGLAGAIGSGLCCMRFDQLSFFGVRQAWQCPAEPDVLQITGPYRFVRHPMMAGLLIFLWAQSVLTPTLALLSGGLSIYILIGIRLEERDMMQRFGAAYEAYRAKVPAFIPWRKPSPAASHPAQTTAASSS